MKSARLSCLILLLFYCLSYNYVQAQTVNEITIDEEYKNQPLTDFLVDLQTKYKVKVFYKEVWVTPYTINYRFENTPLVQALNNIFYNHDLTYELFQDDGIVVFRRIADTRSKYDNFSQILVVGNPMNLGRYKTATLSGRVLDGKNGEPLAGAVIFNNKLQKGTTSDEEGNFELHFIQDIQD